jgi:hypothetical protein
VHPRDCDLVKQPGAVVISCISGSTSMRSPQLTRQLRGMRIAALAASDHENSDSGNSDLRRCYRVRYLPVANHLSDQHGRGSNGYLRVRLVWIIEDTSAYRRLSNFGLSSSREVTAMDAEPPQRVEPDSRDGRKARRALWFACAGLLVGLAIAVASALGDTSMKQAVMLGLPAAVLTFGGLTIAVGSDPETAERQGFRAGLKAGSLRRRWRAVFARQGKGRP